jgi:hypothetical protein
VRIEVAAALSAAFILCGCASVVSGTTQQILISSSPEQGADCVADNEVGRWSFVTPAAIEVHKSQSPLRIVCHKAGWRDTKDFLTPGMNSTAMVGMLLPYAGIVNAAVDGSDGAAMEYPRQFNVVLRAAAPASPASGAASSATPVKTSSASGAK